MAASWLSPGVIGFAALTAGGALAWWAKPGPVNEPPALAQIESMGHLVSVRVQVADVVEFTEPRAISGLEYGGTTVLLIAKGDCSLASDLRRAEYESVDREARQLTLVLPTPRVFAARVNHSNPNQGGSKLFRIIDNGLEPIIPGTSNRTKAVNEAYVQAERRVAAACAGKDLLAQARKNTEELLLGLYRAAGWGVTFKWRS